MLLRKYSEKERLANCDVPFYLFGIKIVVQNTQNKPTRSIQSAQSFWNTYFTTFCCPRKFEGYFVLAEAAKFFHKSGLYEYLILTKITSISSKT